MMRNLLRSIYRKPGRHDRGGICHHRADVHPARARQQSVCASRCFWVGSLHFAVEDGARCASVKTSICPGHPDGPSPIPEPAIWGPNVSPTFAHNAAAACGPANTGNSVTGTVNYTMDIGLRTFVIPISATACYP